MTPGNSLDKSPLTIGNCQQRRQRDAGQDQQQQRRTPSSKVLQDQDGQEAAGQLEDTHDQDVLIVVGGHIFTVQGDHIVGERDHKPSKVTDQQSVAHLTGTV